MDIVGKFAAEFIAAEQMTKTEATTAVLKWVVNRLFARSLEEARFGRDVGLERATALRLAAAEFLSILSLAGKDGDLSGGAK